MPFLAPFLASAGSALAGIVAQMGLMLLTERVVRRVSVVTLRKLQAGAEESKYPKLAEAIDVIADAWELKDAPKP
jgi:hypothetical protein